MNLYNIQNPKFLKSMNVKQLEELAGEIRPFLVSSISRTGGHLASNLGVVELTIALHYVFDSPKDKIFFDVGHQSYTHKILTGRAKGFESLRQYQGMSGFQKRCESEHDVWEAGHSSTSLSAALGMAVARDLNHEDYQVIPVIGDGSFSNGIALEALNEIGVEKRKMIIVFNDNNMSINKNVGALSGGFSRLRTSAGYTKFKKTLRKNLRTNNVGELLYSGLRNVKELIKSNVIESGIFGEFNLDYIGPVDGNNIHDLIQVFETCKDHEGPVVVHVITQKGKGYLPCERDTEGKWHGVGPFDISSGKPLTETPAGYMSWSALSSEIVRRTAESNDDIVAITPAMMNGSALGKFFAQFPERSFDTGIAEEHAAAFAASLAIAGKRPYFAVYSSFLQRCYDQMNHEIARMKAPVVIGIDRAGLVGADGETHHGVFDIGILSPLPHMIIAEPSNADEMACLFKTAFAQNMPFAIRFPKGEVEQPTSFEGENVEIGSWTKLNDHDEHKVAVLSYGPDVTKILHKVTVNNLPVTVVNCRFIKPLDEKILMELSDRNMKIITFEPDMLSGGLGEHILAWANENKVQFNMQRMGIPDRFVQHGSARLLRKELNLDITTLLDQLQKMITESEE